MLETQIRQWSPLPINLSQFKDCLLNTWYGFDADALQHPEMSNRMHAVIRAERDPTLY